MSSGLKFKRIVVAFDGSKDAVKAVQVAGALAKEFGSELVVVHAYSVPAFAYAGMPGAPVPNSPDLEGLSKQSGKSVLAKGLLVAKNSGVDAKGELLESTSTVQALVEFSETEKADLVVLGTRGMTGFKRMVMGSVSSGVVEHAHCPVLVVR